MSESLEGRAVKSYSMKVYTTNNVKLRSDRGIKREWESLLRIKLPGLTKKQSMDLTAIWMHIFEHKLKEYETEAVALETYRKFGDVIQRQTLHKVKFIVRYR